MKFLIVLALIVTVGCCKAENCWDGLEKIIILAEEQSAIQNVSMDVVRRFSLDVKSVVMWREMVNNMTLGKNEKKSAQTFLDYVYFTFKLANEIEQENAFSYGERFSKIEVFYESPGSLTAKQLCDANKEIADAAEKTAKRRERIEKYIDNVNEKMEDIKAKIQKLKAKLPAIMTNSTEESREDEAIRENAFRDLKKASQDVMDAITGKRVTKSLIIPMFEEIKEAVKIEDKLLKALNKICLKID